MTKYSDFASKLTDALKAAGYNHGKISNIKELYEELVDLSPREMAEAYARKNDLIRINKVLSVFKDVYNKPGELGSMKRRLQEENLPHVLYAYAMRNYPYIAVEGERAGTTWAWIHINPPTFTDAREFVHFADNIENHELSHGVKNKIEAKISENKPVDQIIDELQITDPAALYKVSKHVRYNQQKAKKKIKTKTGTITEAKFKKTTTEPNFIEPDATVQEQPSVEQDIEIEELTPGSDTELQMLRTENNLLKQELKFTRKTLKEQRKFISKLKKYITHKFKG